jgi:hypothetical protein
MLALAAWLSVAAIGGAWACVPISTVTVTPAEARPGDEVTVSGIRFLSPTPVVLHLHSPDGPVLATMEMPRSANTLFKTTVRVPEGMAPGPLVLVATQEAVTEAGFTGWGIPTRTILTVLDAAGNAPPTTVPAVAARRAGLARETVDPAAVAAVTAGVALGALLVVGLAARMTAARRPAPAAVVLLVLAVVSAAGAGGSGRAAAGTDPEVTRPLRLTKDDNTPTRTYSSPAMAVDPEDEDNVAASFAEMRTGRCGVAVSRDGGRTWKRPAEPPALASYPLCFTSNATGVPHAQVAFGRNHALYMAMPGWDAQDGIRTSVLLARSEDFGETWARTLVRDVRSQAEAVAESTRPLTSLAVDRRGPVDVVYVGWTHRPLNVRPFRPAAPVVAMSTDAGRTFAEPVSVMGDYFGDEANWRALLRWQPVGLPGSARTPPASINTDNFGGVNPQLLIGRDGELFAVWSSQTINLSPVVPTGLFVSRSTDGGRTFRVVGIAAAPNGALSNPAAAWTPAGGPQGTIHLVYEDKAPMVQGDRDIQYQRSTDGGQTWTPRRTLNDDDPAQLMGQFLPNIVATADGRVDVSWWDFRHDTGAFLNDAYLVSSPDNGATWSANLRVTDRSIDRKIGPWSNGFDVRQPPGMAATGRYTVMAWDDTRDGDVDGQAQDLYRAFVQSEALPANTSPALVYGFAGVLGLMLAGLVVTGVGIVDRRRSRPPPAAASVGDQARVSVQ